MKKREKKSVPPFRGERKKEVGNLHIGKKPNVHPYIVIPMVVAARKDEIEKGWGMKYVYIYSYVRHIYVYRKTYYSL